MHINNNSEQNLFLLLDLDNNSKCLDDLINLFISREVIENDYKCDKCNKKTKISKRISIDKLSKHLLIWIKRFTCHNKNNNFIDIPIKWNNYTLNGAIIHSGNLYGGHYVYISYINNYWILFNDDNISLITDISQYLLNAYCLYYIKNI